MLGKDDILDLILRECDLTLHLYEKIPPGAMDYRPTEGQRTTHELLRYLSHCAIGGTRYIVEGGWDGYKEEEATAAGMKPDEFPAAMARQKQALRTLFEDLSQEEVQARRTTLPTGEEVSVERGLVLIPLEWMVAYRMQLFLYAKQSGAEIGTANCWAGRDPQPAAT